MKMPMVTVVVPFYRTPKLRLRKCIESLLEQTFSDFELLLIDDGNGDDYAAIKKEYEERDARVRFVYQENSGVSAARNLGMQLAKGEYLSFVDSDDFVEETFLKKMVQALEKSDLAVCGVAEQCFPTVHRWMDRRVFFSQPELYASLQYINFCHNKLYRLSIIREHNIQFDLEVKLGEDALFLAKYFEHCNSICSIDDVLYHYVPYEESAVKKYKPAFWDWEQQVIEQQWNVFHWYPLSERQEQAIVRWLYVKLKDSFYYYMRQETNPENLHKQLMQIMEHQLYQEFKQYNKTNSVKAAFNRNDRMILTLWNLFGANGVKLSWKITNFLKR